MNGARCAVCRKTVDQAGGEMFISHDDCEHISHTKCMDVSDKELACALCEPESMSGQIAAQMKAKIVEPKLGNEDWVTCPVKKGGGNKALKKLGRLFVAEEDDDPVRLVAMGPKVCPVEHLIDKGIGLAHCHAEGVDLVHFLNSGWHIDDLCKFEDIGKKGPQRGLATLRVLGLSPDILVDYKHMLPMETMVERFGLTPELIASRDMNGGVGFHPTEGLRTPKSTDWTLDHLIELGFTFDDLQRIGLRTREQWDALEPTRAQRRALNITTTEIDNFFSSSSPIDSPVGSPILDSPVSKPGRLKEQLDSPKLEPSNRKIKIPTSQPIDIKTAIIQQELVIKPRKRIVK